jgi:hypothetical protein
MKYPIAGVVVLASACGSVKNPAPEEPADALLPDAPTQLAVSAFADGGGVSGVELVLTAPGGAIRARATTTADGTAVLEPVAGDALTAVFPPFPGGGKRAVTMLGVAPGDHLQLGTPAPRTGTQGTPRVTFAANAQVRSWDVTTPCGAGFNSAANATSVTLNLVNCPDTFPVFLVGVNNANQVVTWSKVDGVRASDVTVPIVAMQTPQNFTIDAELPAVVNSFEVEARAVNGDGVGTSGAFVRTFGSAGGRQTVQGPRPIVPIKIEWRIDRAEPEFGLQFGFERLPETAVRYQPDDIGVLPWPTTPVFAGRTATWTQTAGGTFDLGRLELSDSGLSWDVYFPPGALSVELPVLPAELGVEIPAAGRFFNQSVLLIQNLTLESDEYDAARNTPEWVFRFNSAGAEPRIAFSRG